MKITQKMEIKRKTIKEIRHKKYYLHTKKEANLSLVTSGPVGIERLKQDVKY